MQQSATTATIGSKARGVADRDTPLLRNYWYIAAFSEEISRTPMRRTILNEDIVFYRTEDGHAVAVQNRCPHRSFPLHKGFLKGDRIVCNYHGIEFNPDGSCGHVPALNAAPSAIRLDRYPLEEDGPLIWIWMGDAANPDYSRLPRREWTDSPDWAFAKGYMYLKANYLGLHENLMDFSHFAFLHAKWNAATPERALLQTWGTAARRHPVGGLGSIGEMLIEHNHGFGQGRGSNSECSFNQAHLPHDTWLQAPCLGLSFA